MPPSSDSDPYRGISRAGFQAGFGRFFAMPGRVERVDGETLKRLFVPKQTPEARKMLRDNGYFVQGQLKHYGILFDNQSSHNGPGAMFLKKQILAGKCDRVPDHIEQLRSQMTEEWWNKLPPHLLANQDPARFIQKYFLNANGDPDTNKTPDTMIVSRVPTFGGKKLRDALGSVPGICFREKRDYTMRGGFEMTYFIGWDIKAVDAAKRELDEAEQEAEELRQREKQEKHEKYVRESQTQNRSITGQYLVQCDYIDEQWPDKDAGDLKMFMRETSEPGVYEASFDFRVFEGAMLLGQEESKVRDYACARGCDLYDDGSDESDEDSERGEVDADDLVEMDLAADMGRKRKAASETPGRALSKKSKTSCPQSFFLLLRGRETGEGEIYPYPTHGSLKATDSRLVSFNGTVDISGIADDLAFTALKVSDDIPTSGRGESWEDFSEFEYEYEYVARW